jgi:hypothetical protein
MEITLPKTDLHSELIKSKRISKIKIDLDYNPDKIDSNRLFHVDQIRKICIDYRLRFLDFNFFKGGVPDEAYTKLKEFELNHPDLDLNIKMMAPTKLFQLENYDDPLMFVSLGNNYYYMIHKWGNDMSYFRKLFMWPFKNIYNILIYIAIISLLFTSFVPDGIFFYKNNPEIQFFVVFLFMFKSLAAIFIYFGFAMGKNFNENIWNSKFYN